VLSPVLYLGAMGLGLGALIDAHGTASLGGVSYLVFLAPGLLAANSMQTAISNSTYPVLGSVKWVKTYQAAAATPLRPSDIFHGHLLFTLLRLFMNGSIFIAVMAAFGAARSPWILAALPVAVLTGLAFAAPVEAFAVLQTKDQPFALPVLGHVLPGDQTAGVGQAAGLRHAAVARRDAVPVAEPGHGHRGRGPGARGLSGGSGYRGDRRGEPRLPAEAVCLAPRSARGQSASMTSRCGCCRWECCAPAWRPWAAGAAFT
jgi:hypothetical protein